MGVIRNGANGGFSGKAGSVVGSSWKDVDYIKGLSKRRTAASSQLQLEAQAKFLLAITFLKPIRDLLNFTYGSMRSGRATGLNMALKHVVKSAIQGVYPHYSINFPAVQLSVGSLAIATGSVAASGNSALQLTWDPDTNPHNGFADDVLTVLIYDVQTNIFKNGPDHLTRSLGEASIPVRPEMLGKELQVYYFFTSRDGKKISPSFYAGAVIPTEPS